MTCDDMDIVDLHVCGGSPSRPERVTTHLSLDSARDDAASARADRLSAEFVEDHLPCESVPSVILRGE